MKISIIAMGTRGDVQPLLALGKALKNNGHQVCVVAGANFRQWIGQHGLDVADSRVDIQSIMEGDAADEWVKRGSNPFVNRRVLIRLFRQYGRIMMEDAWAGCQGAQAIISGVLSDVFAVSIAEKLGARQISAWLQPSMVATRSGAATYSAPAPDRHSVLNYIFSKLFVESFQWSLSGAVTNRFRTEVLGLPAQTQRQHAVARRNMLVVHGYSPHVVPHPDDWPPNLHTTGYWFLKEETGWQAPRELLEFIVGPSRPICIGFGSMAASDAGPLTDLIIQAVQQSQERAILLSGWTGMGTIPLPPSILRIESAPHEWLFPRVKASVHHGGAGTTAASLRAGIPTVIVSHLADQVFWGHRIYSLGVGPKPITRDRLTASGLANAIVAATRDERMSERAASLGVKIRSEDGVARAVELIEEQLHVNAAER